MEELSTGIWHTAMFVETLTREQRRVAKEKMARQFCDLLQRSPIENLHWTGNKTELMDLVHEVYLSEMAVDGQGRPCGFMSIARRACQVLHVAMPSNPYSMAFNARNRKGVKQVPVFSRYCWLLYFKKEEEPFKLMVRRVDEYCPPL